MKENEQASLSIKKIALITIILIFMLGVGVRATTDSLNTVEIILSDNYKIEVITTKKVVSEILEENHIIVLPTEVVVPALDAEISEKDASITIASINNATELVPFPALVVVYFLPEFSVSITLPFLSTVSKGISSLSVTIFSITGV